MSIPEDEDVLEHERDLDGAWRPVRDVRPPYRPRRSGGIQWANWGLLFAAAATGFAIAMFGPCRSVDPQHEDELANLQSELQSARDRVGQLESELNTPRETGGRRDSARAETEARSEAGTGVRSDTSERRASEPVQQASAATPKEDARRELTPDEMLARETVVNADSAREAYPPPATVASPVASAPPQPYAVQPPPGETDRVALAEPQGAASVYEPPDPAAPIVRSISRSDSPGVVTLQVLAPEQAGWTTQAQPTLYWHASKGMQSPGEFTLVREGEDEPVVRGKLTPPDEAGIQRIELSESGFSLEEGKSYRWTISFDDPGHSATSRAVGGIRRVASPESLRSMTASPVTERLDALERAGLWYDALDLVTRSIEDNSGAKNLVTRRDAMLVRAGIHLPSA